MRLWMALSFPSFDLYPPGLGLLACTTKPTCKQHQGLNPELYVRRPSTLVSELSPAWKRFLVCRGANNEPFPNCSLENHVEGGQGGRGGEVSLQGTALSFWLPLARPFQISKLISKQIRASCFILFSSHADIFCVPLGSKETSALVFRIVSLGRKM